MTEAEIAYWQNCEPDEEDIQFMRKLLDSPKQGWGIPCNHTLYLFDRTRKALVLVEGCMDGLFYRNQKVLALLGWTIEVSPEVYGVAAGAGKAQSTNLALDAMFEDAITQAYQ